MVQFVPSLSFAFDVVERGEADTVRAERLMPQRCRSSGVFVARPIYRTPLHYFERRDKVKELQG